MRIRDEGNIAAESVGSQAELPNKYLKRHVNVTLEKIDERKAHRAVYNDDQLTSSCESREESHSVVLKTPPCAQRQLRVQFFIRSHSVQ